MTNIPITYCELTVWEFRNVQCNAARIRPAYRRSQRDAGREIQQKWGKFDAQEITALKDRDDLVAKLQVKYQLDKPKRSATSMRSRRGGSFSHA